MWRKWNETKEDQKRESDAASVIESAFKCQCHKLSPTLYGIEWAICRDDQLVGWAEYKFRRKRYDTLLLSLAKWERGRKWSDLTGRPFIIFVEWPDGLYWIKTNSKEMPPIVLGGSDRGQNGDKEPCVLIETRYFIKIFG